MRIITGIKRGLKLETPENTEIRPTLDRIKESIFNIIHPIKQNSIVVDLFTGTGNIGLEFISRGSKKVYFVDNSKHSINLTNKNIEKCKFEDRSILIKDDYETALKKIREGELVDYIYIDPPYGQIDINNILKNLINSNIISNNTLIIFEDDKDTEIKVQDIDVVDVRNYGNIFIKFMKKG
ncbi:MAG: 16S rRNA (guanine(966)-N(2))-methyltransferase RsmD [Eubacteriales bacterium]